MHLPSLVVALGACGVWAAPLEPQQPLADEARKVFNPYKPGHADPFDRKVDSQRDKLQPLPWVSTPLLG